MSHPSFPPGSLCLPRAISLSGRPPDLLTVWHALTSVKEGRHPASGADRGVGGEGEGRQDVERSDGDGLRDMEVLIQPSEAVTPRGVGAVSGGTEGHDEIPRKLTFKDMVMGSMERASLEFPIEDMEVEYRKSQGEKGHSNGGANGSRFTILSKHVDGKSVDTDAVAAQLREVIINAGPSASAKGKTVGNVGVGSSKGGMASGDSRSPMGQDLAPGSDAGLVDVDVMRSDALDSATNHVVVHVSDGGRDGGVVANGEPSYSGPIRKVVTKGAHRFNPKTYLRQRHSVVHKSVKKGPDLESGTGDISCALGEAEGLEDMTESQILSLGGTSVFRGEVLKEVPKTI
ncbi:hypothetical protein V6N12_038193 [Hibiscus sabdariffa]|uniref:Uncharacterized protein n=1 Tax=Hibiscus sabdariffa TaxID=183260 RepID=A0ABR2BWU6_9ROSI